MPTSVPVVGGRTVEGTPLGVKYARVGVDQYTPFLSTLGAGATFYEAVWCDVEPEQGTRDWTELDEVASSAEEFGLDLMLKVRVGSCWATGGQVGDKRGARGKTASATPADLGAYDAWLRELVERYGARGVREWAIENEVNSPDQWAGTPDEYAALVERAAGVIREEQPDAVILDSGLSSPTMGVGVVLDLLEQGRDDDALAAYQRYYGRRHSTRRADFPAADSVEDLRSIVTGDRWTSNEAIIDTTFDLADRGVIDRLQVHFYERWDAVPLLLDYVRGRLPADMPFEAWEVGLFNKDEQLDDEQLAAEVTKTVSLMLANGASRVLWLPLAADPNGSGNEEDRMGLLDPDGTPRPVAELYRSLLSDTADATLYPIGMEGLSGLVAEQGDRLTVVTWAESDPVPVSGLDTTDVPITTVTPSSLARVSPLTIGSDPVFMELPSDALQVLVP